MTNTGCFVRPAHPSQCKVAGLGFPSLLSLFMGRGLGFAEWIGMIFTARKAHHSARFFSALHLIR
jgi:hypothetical protein